MREDPLYMSKIRVDSEHVSNRLPAIASVAQALQQKEGIMRRTPMITCKRVLTWTNTTVAVCLATAGIVRHLRVSVAAAMSKR